MAGTVLGGRAAAITNKRKYGSDVYARIGKIGGKVRSPRKGFGTHRELARIAGAKGGSISKRTAAQHKISLEKARTAKRAKREKKITKQEINQALAPLNYLEPVKSRWWSHRWFN